MFRLHQAKDNLFSLADAVLAVLAVFLFLISGLCLWAVSYHPGQSNLSSAKVSLTNSSQLVKLDIAYKQALNQPLSAYVNLFSETGGFSFDKLKTATENFKQELLGLRVSEKMKSYHLNLVLILNKIQIDIGDRNTNAIKDDAGVIDITFQN